MGNRKCAAELPTSPWREQMEARSFLVLRDRLEKAGMLDQWKEFLRVSGALSMLCYREKIEAALRAPGFAGFQLFDIQDCPGQATVLVAILDAFMDSKGLRVPESWRQLCNRTVPLLRFEKYVSTAAESFDAEALLSNSVPDDLRRTSSGRRLNAGMKRG
jgi:hypothetical protein